MVCGKSGYKNEESGLFRKPVMLFILGFFIIFVGVAVLIVASVLSDDLQSFGALIFIGPFPIVVGIGPETSWLVLLVIALAILSIIVFIMSCRKMKR